MGARSNERQAARAVPPRAPKDLRHKAHGGTRMRGTATTDRAATIADACRLLGERLGLDAVGVASDASAGRRLTWWTAAGAPALPRAEDILEGRTEGWIVSPGGSHTVFARTTSATSVHAPDVLREAAEWIAAGELGRLTDDSADAGGHRSDTPTPAPRSPEQVELATLAAALEEVRGFVRDPALVLEDLLERVRGAIGAAQVFHLIERGAVIAVVSAPDVAGERRLPREVGSELGALTADELTRPADDGTTAQLAAVLGARSSRLSAAFCSEGGRLEALLAGWNDTPLLSPDAMSVLARAVSACRVALESRTRSVDALLVRDRTRWSERIHDDLTQSVTSAVLELRTLERRIGSDPETAEATLDDVTREVRRALAEVRGVLFDLEREALPEGAPREPLARYIEDVLRRWELTAEVRVEGDHRRLPKRALAAASVVLREALANAGKHARDAELAVSVVVEDGTLLVEIADGGPGYTPAEAHEAEDAGHFGLAMMRRRVEQAGGELTVTSEPGIGTRVAARLPLTSEGDRP